MYFVPYYSKFSLNGIIITMQKQSNMKQSKLLQRQKTIISKQNFNMYTESVQQTSVAKLMQTMHKL